MKKINMITPLSPQQQYALRRWFYINIMLISIICAIGMYFLIPQFFVYLSLKKEVALWQSKINNDITHANTKESLKKEYDDLRLRNTKVDGYVQQLKNPYAHLAYIFSACKNDIQVESVRLNKKEMEIIIRCHTDAQARTFVKSLTESALFSQVKLISLQRNDTNKQLTCIIKAYAIF